MTSSSKHLIPVAEKLGITGLFLFAATGLEDFSLAITGYFLMAVTACICFGDRVGRSSESRPELWAAVFFVYILIRAGAAYLASPDKLTDISEWTGYYIAASGLPALAVALWLNGSRPRIIRVLLTFLAALLVTILMHSGAEELAAFMDGERAFFGLGNAAGLYIASAILGIVIFAMSQSGAASRGPPWHYFSFLACAAIILFVLSLAMIWHQNRTAFFLSLTAVPLLVLLYGKASAPGQGSSKKPQYLVFFVALLIFLAAATTGTSNMQLRLQEGYQNMLEAVDSDVTSLPKSPLNTRLKLWRVAVHSSSEHPVFGSGPGSVSDLVQHDNSIAQYSHLHNLYLQLLVELGIVGLALYCITFIALFKSALDAYRSHQMRPDMFYFISGCLLLFSLTNLTQVRIDGDHAMFYVTLMFALGMTHAVRR